MKNNLDFVVPPLVPEEVYTNRTEFIDYFYGEEARKAARRRAMSTVLLGYRRMGKTVIFKRVVNRFFFDQDPRSPDAVVPVYFSFSDTPLDYKNFALDYLENFLRYYVGFYTSQPELVKRRLKGEKLLAKIEDSRKLFPFTDKLDWIIQWHKQVDKDYGVYPHQDALEAPFRVAEFDCTGIAVFLDELQNARLPQYNFDVVSSLQEAVESLRCPHFVTGSAMSILAREIIRLVPK